jgi:hypothetical protein
MGRLGRLALVIVRTESHRLVSFCLGVIEKREWKFEGRNLKIFKVFMEVEVLVRRGMVVGGN